MIKKFAGLLFAAVLGIAFALPAAADTVQFDKSVTVKATKADGNATVSWTEMKVKAVEHYVGHGTKAGFINVINVGDAKQVTLANLAKNGGRFNLVTVDGRYLHLECGGNDRTTMPTFDGLSVDCSYEVNGQKLGALVVK